MQRKPYLLERFFYNNERGNEMMNMSHKQYMLLHDSEKNHLVLLLQRAMINILFAILYIVLTGLTLGMINSWIIEKWLNYNIKVIKKA